MSGFRDATQKKLARALRRNMTDAEKILWYHLRAHRFVGLSVRRQAPVGPYIVDFLIPSCRLILEADGGHHTPARDTTRDAYLAALGYRTLRLSNDDIHRNLSGVLTRIAEEAQR
ncbi:hypothetical protein GCM10011360_07070 [Primorskyibacter flagellatus]|uniref:DUF559 domain-containing protein n=1 Tax=Primorskyibacter flagellatus TaxID=1387277 RepID=A0A917EBX4_9RHOB|nr:DUF559 domain-containing protein [Primorskyibacter flagellatus]GGE20991.1 hypothetical protein GCM10011360_07070 [Primorskyibacter flagellatus]